MNELNQNQLQKVTGAAIPLYAVAGFAGGFASGAYGTLKAGGSVSAAIGNGVASGIGGMFAFRTVVQRVTTMALSGGGAYLAIKIDMKLNQS
jgi:hypothetical protein